MELFILCVWFMIIRAARDTIGNTASLIRGGPVRIGGATGTGASGIGPSYTGRAVGTVAAVMKESLTAGAAAGWAYGKDKHAARKAKRAEKKNARANADQRPDPPPDSPSGPEPEPPSPAPRLDTTEDERPFDPWEPGYEPPEFAQTARPTPRPDPSEPVDVDSGNPGQVDPVPPPPAPRFATRETDGADTEAGAFTPVGLGGEETELEAFYREMFGAGVPWRDPAGSLELDRRLEAKRQEGLRQEAEYQREKELESAVERVLAARQQASTEDIPDRADTDPVRVAPHLYVVADPDPDSRPGAAVETTPSVPGPPAQASTIPTEGGTTMTVTSGETTTIGATRAYLDQLASHIGTEILPQLELCDATLRNADMDATTLGHLTQVREHLAAAQAAVAEAMLALNSQHGLMEEAVQATPHAAKTDYYRE